MFKKFVTVLLMVLVLVPAFYFPPRAPKAEAILGFADLVIDIKAMAERIVDGFAMVLAQKLIDRMVSSTVKWAQSGFDGNPAYATDPKQFFTETADGVAGDFLRINASSTLGQFCSPFQANIRLSLTQQYYEPQPFQCTLTGIVGNINNFIDDFSQGGWDAWFSMTQTPTNNPYGAYLAAKVELDSRLASAVGDKKNELNWNEGFLSFKKCDGTELPDIDPMTGKPTGKKTCIGTEKTVTPGTTIKGQLDKVLPSGLNKLITAQHLDQLISSLAAGLLQRYVFGPKGLFDKSSYAGEEGKAILNPKPSPDDPPGSGTGIDVDGDGVPDGMDTDGDGNLDICYYGGTTSTLGPPCKGSKESIEDAERGGGGDQCSADGMQYVGALRDAENAVLAANPDVADLPNIESGGRPNARRFLGLVAEELKGKGFEATTAVLNGNGNPNTGDLIAVWKSGDTSMERYDSIAGESTPPKAIKDSITNEFTGFIPLTCTPSGGNRDCGCKSDGDGGGDEDPGSGGTLAITTVSPTTVSPGVTTITITGTELTSTVQFFDASGGRYTTTGSVNSAKTQVTVLVPAGIPAGNGTVRIYKDSATFSNSKSITISSSGGVVSTTEPTSSWSPTLTNNGWWAKLSPDGRYVAYGNWGESWVTDLESATKQSWNFSNPSDLPAGTRCIAGKWMSATKLTFTCELTASTMARYEVVVGEWVARRTADNTSNVAANEFAAGGDHWESYAVGGGTRRIVKDNQLLASGADAGGGLTLWGDQSANACDDNFAICVWNNFTRTKKYNIVTGVTGGPDLYNGYIAYASVGYIYGITPTGTKTDISVTGWKSETAPQIVNVNGARWVATFAGNESIGYYFLLRPWGEKRAITVKSDGLLGSVVYKDGNFLISEFYTNGRLQVITIPADAPRISI